MFAAALTEAADAGYAAVAHPVEGTMLKPEPRRRPPRARRNRALCPDVALAAARAAHEALNRTPDQLEILRRAGVVDAGGRGLTVVLDALDILTGRRPLDHPRTVTEHAVPSVTVDTVTVDATTRVARLRGDVPAGRAAERHSDVADNARTPR